MRLAIQPVSANQCSNLAVVIEDETILSITDDGRGLPIEQIKIGESIERPKIEFVFSGIFSTNPLPSYYQEFGFLNYLGFVLNAVSERLQVETHFEGNIYELTCSKGEIVDHLHKVENTLTLPKGTRLIFTPDPDLFPYFRFELEKLLIGLVSLKQEYQTVDLVLEDKKSGKSIRVQN